MNFYFLTATLTSKNFESPCVSEMSSAPVSVAECHTLLM